MGPSFSQFNIKQKPCWTKEETGLTFLKLWSKCTSLTNPVANYCLRERSNPWTRKLEIKGRHTWHILFVKKIYVLTIKLNSHVITVQIVICSSTVEVTALRVLHFKMEVTVSRYFSLTKIDNHWKNSMEKERRDLKICDQADKLHRKMKII